MAERPNTLASMNPAWASTDPTAGAEPSPTSRTWAPEYTLPNRPQSGPLTRDRQPLAAELRPATHVDPAVSSPTAVPVGPGGDAPVDEAYRYEAAYHNWYYSQHPRDPRVPPPLGNPVAYSRAAQGVTNSPQPTNTGAKGESPSVSPGSSLTQMPESSVLAQLQARGNGVRPVQHPLSALRRVTAGNPQSPQQAPLSAADSTASVAMPPPARPQDSKEPPPLRGLGPVARPSAITPPNGRLEGSTSLQPDQPVPGTEGDLLEGSAATWIDGLPIPQSSLNASHAHGKSRTSSRSSRGSQGKRGVKAYSGNRGQPSPTLRQYKEEALQMANAAAKGGSSAESKSVTPAATPAGDAAAADGKAAESMDQSASLPFDKPYQPPRGVWDFMAIAGHVVEFACDQDGSRLVQSLLEDPFNLTSIFCEVHPHLSMLVSHQFGNYCAQRLLELGKPTHKLAVMAAMKGRMPQLAVDTYGCRVIQRALDTIIEETTEEMTSLANELEGHVATLVVDQNGNHVVQKLMDRMPPHKFGTTFLITSFIGRMHDIGMHCYGCRVIQKLFESCGDGTKFSVEAPGSPFCAAAVRAMNSLVMDVVQNIHSLVVDQYGNYVVQHLIANGSRETRGKAIASLTPRIPELSVQKFSSNVVERVLACATDAERDNVCSVLCSSRTFSAQSMPPIVDMTRDKYANYVVQRLIELASPPQKEALVAALAPHVNEIRTTTYGVHLLSRLERIGWLPQGSSGLAVPPGGMRGRGRGGRGGHGGGGHMGGRGGGGLDMYAAQQHAPQQQHQHQQQHSYASMNQAPATGYSTSNPYDPSSYQQPQQFTPYAQATHHAYTTAAPTQQYGNAAPAAQSYSLFSGADGSLYAQPQQQLYGAQAPTQVTTGYGASSWGSAQPAAANPYMASQGQSQAAGALYAQQYAALQQQTHHAPQTGAYGAAPSYGNAAYSSFVATGPSGYAQPAQSTHGAPSAGGYSPYPSPMQTQAQQQQVPQQQSPTQPGQAASSGMLDPSKLTPQEQQMLLAALAFLQQQQQQGTTGQAPAPTAPGAQPAGTYGSAAAGAEETTMPSNSSFGVRHDPYNQQQGSPAPFLKGMAPRGGRK